MRTHNVDKKSLPILLQLQVPEFPAGTMDLLLTFSFGKGELFGGIRLIRDPSRFTLEANKTMGGRADVPVALHVVVKHILEMAVAGPPGIALHDIGAVLAKGFKFKGSRRQELAFSVSEGELLFSQELSLQARRKQPRKPRNEVHLPFGLGAGLHEPVKEKREGASG